MTARDVFQLQFDCVAFGAPIGVLGRAIEERTRGCGPDEREACEAATRPSLPSALLCGPPGSGKTSTVNHLLATRFRVREGSLASGMTCTPPCWRCLVHRAGLLLGGVVHRSAYGMIQEAGIWLLMPKCHIAN